jgi:hypothetical protein
MRKLVLLLLVAPLALAACGSSRSASAVEQVRTAIARTSHAPSAHLIVKQAGTAWTGANGNRAQAYVRSQLGDVDNVDHLVRMRWSHPRMTVVLTPKDIYFRHLSPRIGGNWERIALGRLQRAGWTGYVPSFVPYLPGAFRHPRRAVELSPGHFRIWVSAFPRKADVWVSAAGFVTRLRYVEGPFIETVELSRFGEHVSLSVPPHTVDESKAIVPGARA